MIEVTFLSEDEKVQYGVSMMPQMPRKGDFIWLQNKLGSGLPRITPLKVSDVAYWAPNRASGYKIDCTSGVAFVREMITARGTNAPEPEVGE